ncbi:hypothetical protein HPB51_006980 [Rhipicephalus microplus]|uniref:Uncharacterized protein n=1 Tax=Rhipicephalus microplus TaxID=6941 RepID=A0A9J6ERW2_RHIMP|nr:hypothetical protein HPB51_006980 [Rhipicephalus microplus]
MARDGSTHREAAAKVRRRRSRHRKTPRTSSAKARDTPPPHITHSPPQASTSANNKHPQKDARNIDPDAWPALPVAVFKGVKLTRDEWEDITVNPIPRNVQLIHLAGHDVARALVILRKVRSDTKSVPFGDATQYNTWWDFGASVVDGKRQLAFQASVGTD